MDTLFAREHQVQCHADRTDGSTPTGIIQTDGTLTPEAVNAIRRTVRTQGGGDVDQALGSR